MVVHYPDSNPKIETNFTAQVQTTSESLERAIRELESHFPSNSIERNIFDDNLSIRQKEVAPHDAKHLDLTSRVGKLEKQMESIIKCIKNWGDGTGWTARSNFMIDILKLEEPEITRPKPKRRIEIE